MTSVRTIDMEVIDELFGMGSGYVLGFSDRTMRSFFAEELDIDIDDARYATQGTSKAKRLRRLLQISDVPTVLRVLHALWGRRQWELSNYEKREWIENAEGKFLGLLNRIQGSGTAESNTVKAPPATAFDRARVEGLKASLHGLTALAPQPRGFAFEKFLHDLFDVYRLSPRASFRNVGEQIDGSFQLAQDTYLLEAKWQSPPCDAADLRAFHGKVESKAAWARGLFISISGFSQDGLVAFGTGRRVLCMDALDLWEMLDRGIPFPDIVERKARSAAETGAPFVRVRDLFR